LQGGNSLPRLAERPSYGRSAGEHKRQIGLLFASPEGDAEVKKQIARFQDAVAKLSWVEGRTIHLDYPFGADNVDIIRNASPTQCNASVAL
jgi:hypothetical protein